MKVALVHDWINGMRGGERCLEVFLRIYPQADIFTLFHTPGKTIHQIDSRVVKVSWLNKLPGAQKFYRFMLPLYPFAIRQFNFTGYDLVISLSHAAAKNVSVPKNIPHIVYCFTPMRYIWDQAWSYFKFLTPLLWPVILCLRRWDLAGSKRPQAFIAISKFIQARIRCFYKRSSTVIHPPVETAWIEPRVTEEKGEAFLWAGALVPYKRPDLVIEVFNKLGEKLWVVGDGPELSKLRLLAKSNIHFLGRLTDQELAEHYRRCRALIFPGIEDFGIIPVECLAAGRPVIGLDRGGLKDTLNGIRHWNLKQKIDPIAVAQASGVFIRYVLGQELKQLEDSIRYFEEHESGFKLEHLLTQAKLFSVERFKFEWNQLLQQQGLNHLVVKMENHQC
jgi:glycosyltransferase involved in cell wall biosynthesis